MSAHDTASSSGSASAGTWSSAPMWRSTPSTNAAATLSNEDFMPTLDFPSMQDLPLREMQPILTMSRGRHAATSSLSTIPSFDSRPNLSTFDTGIAAGTSQPRGRARAGTLPSRFDATAPGVPIVGLKEQSSQAPIGGTEHLGIPSLNDNNGFPFFTGTDDTDALGQTQENSLAKTLDYLGLSDEPRILPLPRDRARTDAAMMNMRYNDSIPLSTHRFLHPQGPTQVAPTAPSMAAALGPAPPLISRAPGYGRARSGTVAAMSGPDGRQRTETELQRAFGLLSSDVHATRLRSNSMHLLSGSTRKDSEECYLCITRLSTQVTTRLLLRLFEPYGLIKDILLFPQHGAALIQFEEPSHAEQAAEAGATFIGAYLMECLGDQTVLPQFLANSGALPDSAIEGEPISTRVVEVSPVPPGITHADLMHLFSIAGPIEHISSKANVSQITYDSAEEARMALQLNGSLPFGGTWPLCVFSVPEEKIWPRRQPRTMRVGGSGTMVPSSDKGGVPLPSDLTPALDSEMQQALLKLLHFQQGEDPEMQTMDSPVEHTYAINIPMPADGGRASRRMDHAKYRELRKTLEAHQLSQEEVDNVAREQLSVIVDLARNYIGNTVVQRFFEQCSETVKTEMLERLAPHLASLGTHKNGTWAAQKIIDCVRTEEQQDLITTHMQPYVPSLLLDQFGNYVVQCVLPFGFPKADFIMDAMVDRCWEIAQGRFGARSMRTCLEHPGMPRKHIKRVALAIILHCVPLSTSSNGTLLLTWLFESSGMSGISQLIAPRFIPYMPLLCTHKLASGIVLRIMMQADDLESARLLLNALFDAPRFQVLEEVLLDPVHGVLLVGRALLSPALDAETKASFAQAVSELLQANDLLQVRAYQRLADELSSLPFHGTQLPLVGLQRPPPGLMYPVAASLQPQI